MNPSFKDHFSTRSAAYAAHRPTYPKVLAETLAKYAPQTHLAWDCGCGTGQLSVLLGDVFERVVATDASAKQIANATPHPNVAYRCAPAEASGLPDSVADLIVAAQAAHWFDLPVFYAEARRVGRPGSTLALVTYAIARITHEIDAVIEPFYSGVLGAYWPPERRHPESSYRLFDFPFDEFEAPSLEIELDWTSDDFIGYVDTWSAVRALERAEGRTRFNAFAEDLAHAWGPEPRPVRWPLSFRIGYL